MSPTPPLPPNRQFGLFFSVVFALVGFYLLWQGQLLWPLALFFVASLLFFLALVLPKALTPLNRGWLQLGLLLGRIISPLVIGLLFFLLITPVALLTRLFGRDALRLKKQQVDSYWLQRESPDPADSFKNQF
jgi:hypothetical protein